jgi:hypothetical protein
MRAVPSAEPVAHRTTELLLIVGAKESDEMARLCSP